MLFLKLATILRAIGHIFNIYIKTYQLKCHGYYIFWEYIPEKKRTTHFCIVRIEKATTSLRG